ncbi:MAG: hypothetical protein ABIL53_07325, partial [candidate division WOR-3 bacterium]
MLFPLPYYNIRFMAITLGVLKEKFENERRVALVPSDIKRLVKEGYEVLVERG